VVVVVVDGMVVAATRAGTAVVGVGTVSAVG
jgi:hypothetical protein